MPNLNFKIIEVQAVERGLTPQLHFKLQICDTAGTQAIQALLLNAQIQLLCPQRAYTDAEEERLLDLFGPRSRWPQTLRNRLWAHSNTTVGAFTGRTETILPVACSYDLNLSAAKYLYALNEGEVSLLFLFSGSVFYTAPDGRLQVERISWNKECTHQMPIRIWQELMEQHYPNAAWIYLRRDVFDRLYAYKRHTGAATWEQALEGLLRLANPEGPILSPGASSIAHPEEVPA